MSKSIVEKLIRERQAEADRASVPGLGHAARSSTDIARDIAAWLMEHGPAYASADGYEAYVLEPSASGPSWRQPDAFPYCWNVFPMRPDARCAMSVSYHGYQEAVSRLRERLEFFGIDPDAFGAPARIAGTRRRRGAAA